MDTLWFSRRSFAILLAGAAASACARASATTVEFTGDYSTGDFSQWPDVQNQDYVGPGEKFQSNSAAGIVKDSTFGDAARYEIKPGLGDERGMARTEVLGASTTGGGEGEVMWYKFATKFDATFPTDHASHGSGITNQFWGAEGAGPPISWNAGKRNGYWSLVVQKQSHPGEYLRSYTIFETPLDVGNWHKITMQIRWSPSDNYGWIRLWINGERQQFFDRSDTYSVRTLIPGTRSNKYKEGYYREQSPKVPVGIVYHAGFKCGMGSPPHV